MSNVTHVVPVGDLKEHIQNDTGSCWCNPEVDVDEEDPTYGTLIVHNAADGREQYENKTH